MDGYSAIKMLMPVVLKAVLERKKNFEFLTKKSEDTKKAFCALVK